MKGADPMRNALQTVAAMLGILAVTLTVGWVLVQQLLYGIFGNAVLPFIGQALGSKPDMLVDRASVVQMVDAHRDELLTALAAGDDEALAAIPGVQSVFQGKTYIELNTGGYGLVMESSDFGILYSKTGDVDGVLRRYGGRVIFVPDGNGLRYVQEKGDDMFYVEPLGDGLYYYAEHY